MRTFLFAALVLAGCTDNEIVGEYTTTWSTTIARDSGAPITLASPEAQVLVGENGDLLWLDARSDRGPRLDCGFAMRPADGALVVVWEPADDCSLCDETGTTCWNLDVVSATATLVEDQFTLTMSGDAAIYGVGGETGTATATLISL